MGESGEGRRLDLKPKWSVRVASTVAAVGFTWLVVLGWSHGDSAWPTVVGALILWAAAFMSWWQVIVVTDRTLFVRGVGWSEGVDLDHLATVSISWTVPFRSFPRRVLMLQDVHGRRATLNLYFWHGWRDLATLIANDVSGYQADEKTRRRLRCS